MPHPERAAEAILGSDDGRGHRPLARRERGPRGRHTGRRHGGVAVTVAERPVEPLHRRLGVTDEELDAIRDRLGGREPNDLELAMFSVMWSEHCSYKSSKPLLRTLPTAGAGVVAGPGENAGVVSIGDGLAVAFKIESHNHPSAVEPYQGAATGVGGILRDIFTMGARPIAVLDALRFGDPADPRTRHLVDGVVRGVGGYGNCVGVPTVGGELVFDPSYAGNPLVNVMAIGLLEERLLTLAAAPGPGNLVVLYGSATGRDGIGGASVLASATFTDDDPSKRPSVQVGDPFAEKLLIEASLELIERGPGRGAAGPRRRRDHLRDVGDGRSGRDRDRRRPRRDPAPRTRPRAVRGDDLRVAGTDVRRGPARALGRRPRGVRALGPAGRDHRAGDRRRRHHDRGRRPRRGRAACARRPGDRPGPGQRPDQRRDRPSARGSRPDPPPRRPGSRRAGLAERPPARARDGPGRGARRVARVGRAGLPARGLPPVRLDRGRGHRRGTRSRRGRPAGQGHDQGARGHDRRQPGPRCPRSVARSRDGRGRGDAQRVDHRRPSAGRDELPQLRRPDPAGGLLAAVRGRPRARRRLPRARAAGHRRERVALQRVVRRGDRTDRRDRRGRPARGRRDAGRPGLRGRRRCRRAHRRAGPRPGRLGLRPARRSRRRGRAAEPRPRRRGRRAGLHPRGHRPRAGGLRPGRVGRWPRRRDRRGRDVGRPRGQPPRVDRPFPGGGPVRRGPLTAGRHLPAAACGRA